MPEKLKAVIRIDFGAFILVETDSLCMVSSRAALRMKVMAIISRTPERLVHAAIPLNLRLLTEGKRVDVVTISTHRGVIFGPTIETRSLMTCIAQTFRLGG